ncbi:hypothetical protein Goari_021895, partial [Gossypium aridum]|nr:hypothetical protein [Gossypium aridum]
ILEQFSDGWWKSKINFVEVRTYWQVYRSFDRMWVFFIMALQAMIIVAWTQSGSTSANYEVVLRRVLSIFITYAILSFFRAILDVILSIHAWRNSDLTQPLRYLLKLVVAAIWAVVLPVGYSTSVKNPTGPLKFLNHWARDSHNQSLYNYILVLYMIPDLLAIMLFLLPRLREKMELSDWPVINIVMWWAQILPLIRPTKVIMKIQVENYRLHKFVPNVKHNMGVIIAIWSPIILVRKLSSTSVYFMDVQLWYTIFSTLLGGVLGAFRHLGEIRTIGMVHSRFESISSKFRSCFVPPHSDEVTETLSTSKEPNENEYFRCMWNEFISSMRMEDLISNRLEHLLPRDFILDRELLLLPSPLTNKPGDQLLPLTFKESRTDVPLNSEARRRITFFVNSLFMNMASAPKVSNMRSFSVLTPHYNEEVVYSDEELNKENEDGVSTLFYLKTIYPDEWTNFEERMKDKLEEEKKEERRKWVSYRGQTLSRSGQDDDDQLAEDCIRKQKLPDLKFTYIISCQIYGNLKRSKDPRQKDILNLMIMYPSLRVAYIDEVDEALKEKTAGETEKVYYSVLIKGDTINNSEREIYRIRLPGSPTKIGEGKPENQNHAIIFTRGEALQTIDMNQDNYFEEAFKMRNVLEEFSHSHGAQKPTILGLREHVFTGSVSSLAWFMSNQEFSFVTIGQRFLASPLRVRFHYGHPDIFDRIFHITRGGISKASKTINLSEDIFAGFNSTLRLGSVTHHDYMQVGKGRDVGMNQISLFEAKVANGNGEQTLTRDVHRLGCHFDFFRMLSFYCTTVGFYFNSLVTVLIVYVFLYGRLYMVMTGLEREILEDPQIKNNNALEAALVTQSVIQMGMLLVLPMLMEIGLEKGFRTALGDFFIMQLQLSSVFFTFQLGTKAHYFGKTILHGGSKYRATGRGFVVRHSKFADNYRLYSRSHFVKALELGLLLVIYEVYGESYRNSSLYFFITFSMWFLVGSWLFAPFIFNPSGFEWQKTVNDWTDWKWWMGIRGGVGIQPEKSWESWWDEEQEHLRYTSIRGRVLEILLALRFFVYQYGIVYHLDIAHHSRSLLVYGLSWCAVLVILIVPKIVSVRRLQMFHMDLQLPLRMLKGLFFLILLAVMIILFKICGLTLSDLFASILAFMPTGWAFILVGQACRPCLHKLLWEPIKEVARAYDFMMGLLLFTPIAFLSWLPAVNEFQTRILFNQAFSRGLHISMILAGKKDGGASFN